jgi:hypothetical protein
MIHQAAGGRHRYLMTRLSLKVVYLWRHVSSTAPPFILWWWNLEILFAPLPPQLSLHRRAALSSYSNVRCLWRGVAGFESGDCGIVRLIWPIKYIAYFSLTETRCTSYDLATTHIPKNEASDPENGIATFPTLRHHIPKNAEAPHSQGWATTFPIRSKSIPNANPPHSQCWNITFETLSHHIPKTLSHHIA